jgi:hypothetical protein
MAASLTPSRARVLDNDSRGRLPEGSGPARATLGFTQAEFFLWLTNKTLFINHGY